jgi:hypothetical protein
MQRVRLCQSQYQSNKAASHSIFDLVFDSGSQRAGYFAREGVSEHVPKPNRETKIPMFFAYLGTGVESPQTKPRKVGEAIHELLSNTLSFDIHEVSRSLRGSMPIL